MMSAVVQQCGASEIDHEAEHGDGQRLTESDRHRREQPQHAFIADQQRDHRQNKRAGEAGEFAELAGAERKARIVRVCAGKAIGERGNGQRRGVGGHVPAVRHQRHGAEQRAADNLRHHHRGGEDHHCPSAPLVAVVRLAEEHVIVGPGLEGVAVHQAVPCRGFACAHGENPNAFSPLYIARLRTVARAPGCIGPIAPPPPHGMVCREATAAAERAGVRVGVRSAFNRCNFSIVRAAGRACSLATPWSPARTRDTR